MEESVGVFEWKSLSWECKPYWYTKGAANIKIVSNRVWWWESGGQNCAGTSFKLGFSKSKRELGNRYSSSLKGTPFGYGNFVFHCFVSPQKLSTHTIIINYSSTTISY